MEVLTIFLSGLITIISPLGVVVDSVVAGQLRSQVKSVEALASDKDLPSYVFEGPGEILSIKEEYAQVRWRRPVPDVWFKLDQLKEYIVAE